MVQTPLNRLTSADYSTGESFEYVYGAVGNRTVMTDSVGVTTYVYDDLYRLVSVDDPITGTVSYGYDLAGNRTQLTYPTGEVVTYTYDADNRLIEVEDWDGGLTTYGYDGAGRLVNTTLPNGVVSVNEYDAAGRLVNLTHTAADDTILSSYEYELDGVGNRVRVTETLTGTTRVIDYVYDSLNRLTFADYSTGESFEYAYDAVGNRTTMTTTSPLAETTVTTYTYDAANRLLVTESPGHLVSYAWDGRGNLLSDGTFTYTYNTAGRMVRAESITVTLVYTYNAQGLRVAQAVDGDVTTFVWDWASGIPEMLSDGDNLYLVSYDTLGYWDGADWTYHLPDALGSIRQTTNDTGSVTDSREWTPFGVEVGAAQAGPGYTGEWLTPAVGLQYLRARWYDLEAGRFTQRDPWEGNLLEPQTLLQGYVYVLNDPINHVDPSGLCAHLSGNPTDCERFVAEVQLIIETVKRERNCDPILRTISEAATVVDLLAYYYSGIPITGGGFYLSWFRFSSFFQQGTPDRWAVPDWAEKPGYPDFDWDHPINIPNSPLGQEMRQSYGFRRPYFDNTHHYFGYLKLAYYYGGTIANAVNWLGEKPTLQEVRQDWQTRIGTPREQAYEQRYAWYYREAVYDLYIVQEAAGVAFTTKWIFDDNIDFLPQFLREQWCAKSEADVWSLEKDVDMLHFDFPQEYWPLQKYWPGG